jgi:hypothetical protein
MPKIQNNFKLNSKKGQSLVEYLLLLAVLISLSISILNSEALRNLIGPNSAFFETIERYLEFSYRHGVPGSPVTDDSNYQTDHKSYRGGRFFAPNKSY